MTNNGKRILQSLFMMAGSLMGLASCGECNHEYEIIGDTATCENDGVKIHECWICGDRYTVPSSALGHGWQETSRTATCTTDGVITYECVRCHKTKEEPQKALGHWYGDDGKCSRCESNMFDGVTYSFELPTTLCHRSPSGSNLYSKCELTDVKLSKNYEKIFVTFSGSKTYDNRGTYGTWAVQFNCVLKDSSGKIVSSLKFFENDLVVGQDFEKKYELVKRDSFDETESYTLEVADYVG